jgi:hypothetical protein
MKCKMLIGILFAVVVMLISLPAGSYEDLTDQALTKRALQVAMGHDATIPGDFDPVKSLGRQVIAGAGAGPEARGNLAGKSYDTDGEDYTIYTIHRKCPVHYKPTKNDKEPLSHFMPKGLWGHPAAINQFYRFFQDAVFLWKHDKKGDAAKIRLSGGF